MTATSILVRGPNWLGDLAMATPGFRALRADHPGARIVLHVRPGLEPLLAGAPWFDEILPVRSYRAGLRPLLREGRELRSRRFELGVCIPDSFSAALLMRAAGVREVVGYRRGGRGALLHRPVAPDPAWGRRRLVAREEYVCRLVEAIGVPRKGLQLELFCTPEEEAAAVRLLGGAGADDAGGLAILAPGASFGSSKLWPAESFAAVGDALVNAGLRVALVGSPSEADRTTRVAAAMTRQALDLAGVLDVGALKAVVRRAAVMVCNDAGARHVAVAFGVPCIVFMGPTSLEKTPLNLESVDVLTADVDCRPCYLRECPIDHRCMTQIEPERAIERILQAVDSSVAAGPVA